MPEIKIEADNFKHVTRMMRKYPKFAHQAMSAAINRTINRVKQSVTEEVAKEYEVKKTQVKNTITSTKASTSRLQGKVYITGKSLKLGTFKFTKSSKTKPVRVKIKKSGGYVTSTSQPPLFTAKSKVNNRVEVFNRLPKGSPYKITWGFTLSIPQMVKNEDVYQQIAEDSQSFLSNRFEHEFAYRVNRYKMKYKRKK